MRYLLTRVIAYCLCFEEGIAFTKGLSTTDEPAAWVKDAHGNLRLWIEVAHPFGRTLAQGQQSLAPSGGLHPRLRIPCC